MHGGVREAVARRARTLLGGQGTPHPGRGQGVTGCKKLQEWCIIGDAGPAALYAKWFSRKAR